jgi:hypothetical protein
MTPHFAREPTRPRRDSRKRSESGERSQCQRPPQLPLNSRVHEFGDLIRQAVDRACSGVPRELASQRRSENLGRRIWCSTPIFMPGRACPGFAPRSAQIAQRLPDRGHVLPSGGRTAGPSCFPCASPRSGVRLFLCGRGMGGVPLWGSRWTSMRRWAALGRSSNEYSWRRLRSCDPRLAKIARHVCGRRCGPTTCSDSRWRLPGLAGCRVSWLYWWLYSQAVPGSNSGAGYRSGRGPDTASTRLPRRGPASSRAVGHHEQAR